MMMLGDRYSADDLQQLGIAWQVVEDEELTAASQALARRIAEQPARSIQAMKRILNQCAAGDIERALALETDATVEGFLDPETTRRLKDF